MIVQLPAALNLLSVPYADTVSMNFGSCIAEDQAHVSDAGPVWPAVAHRTTLAVPLNVSVVVQDTLHAATAADCSRILASACNIEVIRSARAGHVGERFVQSEALASRYSRPCHWCKQCCLLLLLRHEHARAKMR